MIPLLNAHSPAGASSRQMIHFGQVIRAMLFRKFDFGADNLAIYGQLFPPNYNLLNVQAPTHLYYGANDWLASPSDTAILNAALPNVRLLYQVLMPYFNHMDFVWATNVRSLVYQPLVNTMRLYS